MALSDEVQARYSTQFLANLTRPQDPHPATIDAARLGLAATDVEGDFLAVLGRPLDLARKEDVAAAVEGVIAKLEARVGPTGEVARQLEDRYLERLRSLRGPADPATSSQLQPTDEARGQRVVRPTFDDPQFDWFRPDATGAADDVT